MQNFLVTVDVEALPARAEKDHIDRLIWGSFPGTKAAGLREMMSEAERHSLRLTCFFDYCEFDLYGDRLLEVAREIAARGHDLQLHAHPELMHTETWKRLGMQKPAVPLNDFSEDQADRLFDWLLDMHAIVSTTTPVAFRGGGYRYSASILAAMKRKGLLVSSNHNPGRQNQFDLRTSCESFRHANGILEFPISVLQRDSARLEFNFNAHRFSKEFAWFIPYFRERYGDRSVLNLVTHSRSFLALDAARRYFAPTDNGLMESYGVLLAQLKAGGGQVSGVEELSRLYASPDEINVLTSGEARDTAASPAGPDAPPPPRDQERAIEVGGSNSSRGNSPRSACTVCGAPASLLKAFNGRPFARCTSCGALERQRSLVQVWNASLRKEIPTNGQLALLVSPAKSERKVFTQLGFRSTTTLDIRPEAECDVVADLCSTPQIADSSFSLVFASHVLPHLHDLDGALSEIARILTPAGVFLSFTPTSAGQPTVILDTDAAGQGWYGPAAMASHRVGTFRKFGDLGLLQSLQRHFVVKTFHAEDPITRRQFMWTCAWKLSAANLVRELPANGAKFQTPK